ncbi:hypothetical protein SAMN05428944_7941 [Streptomyces sp. 1222.5]|uniref:hypothetical protein n=1 Tax=unclassified Streptomyces TaxID=2593676 RepID=UPI00089C311C|nr:MULTISPECIES: hypothetical protein [unclassified Streptomyces]PKW00280.1 hypothetical protein BX260_7950 [Streptomyces sp. 5112.2]SED84763.1 hypothetical protein SAMN05428944_7941 [Streptomyces sp. 1222.5]
MSGHRSPGLIAVAGENIAAGVGAGIADRSRIRPVAAWAWMWRNFDAVLPDGDVPPTDAADRPLRLWPGTVPEAGGVEDEGLLLR